ncbi:acyltransferase [Vibrio astriarenae]|uniref:acyltransferase n=1 Tax=Vibrio astriarenae TaxID=1481923 RepID=UPI00373553F3
MTEYQKIASVELGRVIAIIAVIAIHSQLMTGYPLFNNEPWLGNIINQLSRFAVPFFFITSGYFLQPKLEKTPLETGWRYCKPLIFMWVIWSIIYLIAPFNLHTLSQDGWLAERSGYWSYLAQAPLNSFLEGGMVHLWFLPSLIMAVGIIAVLVHLKRAAWLLPLSASLYLYGVSAGSYQPLTDLQPLFFTRNGPFFSLLMVSAGFLIRQHRLRLSSLQATMIMLIGFIGHFSEAFALTQFDIDFRIHDFLFSTSLWAVGFFLLLLANPSWGNHPWIFSIANMTLGIYLVHLLLIIYMSNLAAVLEAQNLARDGLVFFGALISSVILTFLISRSPSINKLFFK